MINPNNTLSRNPINSLNSIVAERERKKRRKDDGILSEVDPEFRDNMDTLEDWDPLSGDYDIIDIGWDTKDQRNIFDEGQKQRATNYAVSQAKTKYDPVVAMMLGSGQRGLSRSGSDTVNTYLPALAQRIGATNAAMQSVPFQYDYQEAQAKMQNSAAAGQMFQTLSGLMTAMRRNRLNDYIDNLTEKQRQALMAINLAMRGVGTGA